MGVSDLARIPGAANIPQSKPPSTPIASWLPSEPSQLQETRQTLWGPGAGELNPEQLERHRKLQGLMAERNMKELGGIGINHPVGGPATLPVGGGHVMVGSNAGTLLRNISEEGGGDLAKRLAVVNAPVIEPLRRFGEAVQNPPPAAQNLLQAFGGLGEKARKGIGRLGLHRLPQQPEPAPVDRTLQNAVVQHEGGEKAVYRGSRLGAPSLWERAKAVVTGRDPREGFVPARPAASHLGELPNLEEKHVTWRDPEAQDVFQKIRQSNPDDAAMEAMHRRFGGRPDMPIPMGGKQHEALLEAVGKMSPQVPNAALFRGQLSPKGLAHGMSDKAFDPIRGMAQDALQRKIYSGNIPGLGQREVHLPTGVQNAAMSGLNRFFSRLTKHPTEAPGIANRVMRLRSLVRS
jgi:hypothetical protein